MLLETVILSALPVLIVLINVAMAAGCQFIHEQAEDYSAARLDVASQHFEHCHIIMRSEVGENREQANEIKTVLVEWEPGIGRQWLPVGVIHFVMGIVNMKAEARVSNVCVQEIDQVRENIDADIAPER